MNEQISDVFRRLALDTAAWRTDGGCTTRIGMAELWTGWCRETAMVHVSDMRQGHGQSVTIDNAEKLNVRVITRRDIVERVDVDVADLYDTILNAVVEVRV